MISEKVELARLMRRGEFVQHQAPPCSRKCGSGFLLFLLGTRITSPFSVRVGAGAGQARLRMASRDNGIGFSLTMVAQASKELDFTATASIAVRAVDMA